MPIVCDLAGRLWPLNDSEGQSGSVHLQNEISLRLGQGLPLIKISCKSIMHSILRDIRQRLTVRHADRTFQVWCRTSRGFSACLHAACHHAGTVVIVLQLHTITVVCPRLLTVGASVFLLFFFVLFNFVRCPCNVFDTIVTLISTFLLTYLCSVSYLFLENPDTDSARPISRCRLRVFHYAFCNCLVTGEWQQNFRRHASHRAASLRQLNILLNEHYYLSHFGFWFFFEFRSINQSIYLSI